MSSDPSSDGRSVKDHNLGILLTMLLLINIKTSNNELDPGGVLLLTLAGLTLYVKNGGLENVSSNLQEGEVCLGCDDDGLPQYQHWHGVWPEA